MSVPQRGDVVDAKYVVGETLGEGGMGVVVAARDARTGERVAIKFLRPELAASPDLLTRFRREARALATVDCEHVVRVHGSGTLASGSPYIVMEHLVGNDLGHESSLRGALPEREAIDYALQVCDGLAQIHARGVVHRDLKPSNLVLTRAWDGSAVVKIVDFGISKTPKHAGDKTLTHSALTLGSPLYMSPEQLRNARCVDHRTDIWSLGVILHKLLAGRAPFEGNGVAALCLAIVADRPIPLRAEEPDISVDVERIVLRCLEKDPDARYDSAEELAYALGRVCVRTLTPRLARASADDVATVSSRAS